MPRWRPRCPCASRNRDRVLEVIGVYISAKGLDRLERNTVARIDVSHFTFTDDDEWFLMDTVLPRIQAEVDTTTQEPGLKAGFTITGNDLAFPQRTFAAPDLFNDTDMGVWDINNPEQTRQAEQHQNSRNNPYCPSPWNDFW